jgi:DNA-binding beta-propeller fold protein YncE
LLEIQERPLAENVLKLFNAVTDPIRNRVYVAGILTPGIAVLDGATETWVDVFDSGLAAHGLKYLNIDPAANILYIFDATAQKIVSVDLETYTQLAQMRPENAFGQFLVADTDHGRLYILQNKTLYGYDGRTLTEVVSAPLPGEMGGPMIYDAAGDRIFILAAGRQNASQPADHLIYVFDAAAGQFTDSITYEAPPRSAFRWMAYDPAQKQFALASNFAALLIREDGREVASFSLSDNLEKEEMVYLPESGALAFIGAAPPVDGQIVSNQSDMVLYDVGDGRLRAQFAVGHKVHRLAYNPANGRIYLPNGDASVVWSVDTAAFDHAVPLRLGDSVEDIVVSGNGRSLTVNSRLGGSYLAAFDLETGQMNTFANGVWPIPLERNETGDRLFVLNAWDSVLGVYDYSDVPALLGSIPLGLPPGSTDRLPDLTIDSQNKLAYAAYPEFGQIAVVNWEAMEPVTLITVPDVRAGDDGGGPGNLQLAVNPAAGRLYVFNQDSLELLTYDATQGYGLIGRQNVRNQWPLTTKSADLLFADTAANRLFVGPLEFDGVTGAATGRSLAQGDFVFALDEENGRYLTAQFTSVAGGDLTSVLAALDRETLAAQWTQPLGDTAVLPPAFAWNPVRHEIYVGYMTDARIDVYAVHQ